METSGPHIKRIKEIYSLGRGLRSPSASTSLYLL